MASLRDVAEVAGVSRATASRVVNGQPGVSAAMRERVMEAVARLGYQPHPVARSLATKRTRIIGVLVPEPVSTLFLDLFFSPLLQGMVQAARARGYQVMLTLFPESEDQDGYVQPIQNGYLDGAVAAVSVPMSEVLIPHLVSAGFPVVCIGQCPWAETSFVDVNDVEGARLATEHLLRLGHRRLATITGPANLPVTLDRLRGFELGLKQFRLQLDGQRVREGDFTESGGMMAMQELLASEPDAVFVQSDAMAIGALKAIRKAGLRVPDDIALVGFDDVPLAALVEPPLTTIRQPIRLLGFMAAEILIDELESPPRKNQRRQLVFPTELVVRESCGALQAR